MCAAVASNFLLGGACVAQEVTPTFPILKWPDKTKKG
jgi:hypothetical protein